MDSLYQQSLFEIINDDLLPQSRVGPVEELERLRQSSLSCSACDLRKGCLQVVFAQGNPRARMMLVGEGPGAEEDRAGIPFVGPAGRLLNRILEAAGLAREDLYITNVVKCRPPGNRLPEQPEVDKCVAYLKKQIELINPVIIVCLGALATKTLIDRGALITRVRGQWFNQGNRRLMPTFHPAALLRDPTKKKSVWEDFKEISRYYRSLRLEAAPRD